MKGNREKMEQKSIFIRKKNYTHTVTLCENRMWSLEYKNKRIGTRTASKLIQTSDNFKKYVILG